MKLATVAVFGAGYVLRTKAGRERYAQIVGAAQSASRRLESYGNGGRRSPHHDGSADASRDTARAD